MDLVCVDQWSPSGLFRFHKFEIGINKFDVMHGDVGRNSMLEDSR